MRIAERYLKRSVKRYMTVAGVPSDKGRNKEEA